MSALSQEVPLLPVLALRSALPEQRMAALRQAVLSAMAAYERNGACRGGQLQGGNGTLARVTVATESVGARHGARGTSEE